jgi:hypothetical protein
MPLKHRSQKYSKISEPKFRDILKYFAIDSTAYDTAKLTMVRVINVNTTYLKLRNRIVKECGRQTPFSGVIELDESNSGPKTILCTWK